MPKQTFFNIKKEKRERIEQCAIVLFSKKKYEKVTINSIVEQSNISKGSFYQYFEDKFDLYYYIIGLIGKEKMNFFKDNISLIDESDFFNQLRSYYILGLKFAINNVEYGKITSLLMKSTDKTIIEKIAKDNKKQSIDFYKQLIITGIKNGDIRSSINVNETAEMLLKLHFSCVSYYYKSESDFDNTEYLMSIVNQMINFIKNGLIVNKKS